MSTESTETGETSGGSELSERELLFNAYVDGELSADREAEFDERLRDDPNFRDSYGEFAEVVDGVRDLPYEFAPDDFAESVRDRIRRRSRGRLFSDGMAAHRRTPYEVVAVVMFVLMASAYLILIMPSNHDIESTGQKRLEVPGESADDPGNSRRPAPED